ncbi:coiled-coil domain-containing protein 125 isoform X3 [Dasypus novemcinctus]|uniref:coiled-coil domain-containing protein 125 isoform X3 n=1 Tax=Dasypus novemcinctus TaxID=9361 RepID=UPI0039C92538
MSKVVRSLSESEVQLWGTEDGDMTEGDLGYGLGRRPGGIYEVEVSHLFTSRKRSDGKNFSPPPFSRQGEESSGGVFQYSKHKSLQDFYSQGSRVSSYQRQSSTDSDSGLSTIELRQRLHETLEEVEFLKTELEASQRQLEGKEEALKILQSMAIFGKATSHTQAVFKKTVEQKRSLEKEINALQWEIEFDQNRFKNIEESWTQKYDRLNCENAVLKETLKLKTEEIKMLKSENAILNQQYLEALAMLDIKQQKMAQENMCHSKSSCFTEISGLEVARGPWSLPLSWSWRDPLFLCQNGSIYSETAPSAQTRGTPSHGNKKSLGQKLLDMLPSENSSKKTEDQDNPQEVFKMLIDLLNDKEAALAHQRKVSYMLARALEDKDTASKQNKEKIPMGENFPLKNPCHKTSEFPVLRDPLYSNVQIFNSVGCFCSIHCPATDQNYIRTLKKSCSLPSGIMF